MKLRNKCYDSFDEKALNRYTDNRHLSCLLSTNFIFRFSFWTKILFWLPLLPLLKQLKQKNDINDNCNGNDDDDDNNNKGNNNSNNNNNDNNNNNNNDNNNNSGNGSSSNNIENNKNNTHTKIYCDSNNNIVILETIKLNREIIILISRIPIIIIVTIIEFMCNKN